MSQPTMVVYLVWSREGRAWDGEQARYEDPITYREWRHVVGDIKAALDHGRQIRVASARLSRATWRKYSPPSSAQVRRLRGSNTRETAD